MKKFFKILGLIILSLILCSVAYYLYLTDFGRKNILSNEPRQPKLEIPVTYNIGWWSNQKDLSIESLNIEIVESKLNLFNSKSLISYRISGKLTYDKFWRTFIDEVHISERINNDSSLNCGRIIEITPVLNNQENKKPKRVSEKFEFKNEHTITSNRWGINRIKIICGDKEQTIELHQYK
jgi:hypothetical protein